jgi:hypothetical protein
MLDNVPDWLIHSGRALDSIARSKPTAFQAVSFQQVGFCRVPHVLEWRHAR